MISRGASVGAVRSVKALCGAKRARPLRFGIEAFEQQRFIGAHLRHVEPSMRRIVAHRMGLADAMRINELRGHEIVETHRPSIRERERGIPQWTADRPPQVDDLDTALQSFIGLLGQQVADPLESDFAV